MANIKQITLPSGTTYDIADAVARAALDDKVDKVTGKGLSTNDYTTAEKTKLAGIDSMTAAEAQTGTSTTARIVSAKVMTDEIERRIASASLGAATFKGLVDASTDISNLSSYYKGWYWVVATAGTYVGQTCEVGDFIFCIADKGSAYSANDFNVIQANIDMSAFGDLAYEDTASASYTPAGTVSQPTFTGTQGSVSVSTTGAVTAVSGSVNTTSTNGIDIKPAGTVSTPTITVTPATTTKYVAASTTGGGSVTAGTAATCTMPTYTVSNENLTITAGSFTANTPTAVTLPSFTSQTIATGITSATSTQPTFSGTQKYLHLSTTKDSVTSTGNFTPAGSVSQPTFTGTQATITVS